MRFVNISLTTSSLFRIPVLCLLSEISLVVCPFFHRGIGTRFVCSLVYWFVSSVAHPFHLNKGRRSFGISFVYSFFCHSPVQSFLRSCICPYYQFLRVSIVPKFIHRFFYFLVLFEIVTKRRTDIGQQNN